MDRTKKKQLDQAGWRVGSVSEFLDLSETEAALIEMKMSLGARLRKARERNKLTQVALARLMKSSQSRVAKMEAGDIGTKFQGSN